MRTLTDIRRDMHDYLPLYYADVEVVGNIVDREADEITDLNAAIYDVLAQFFLDTATWGLTRWEREFGIQTDETKPIEQRRSVIRARIRGIGTVTAGLIENVAESYMYGDVDVSEDNANYSVIITFVSKYGVPPNINDVKTAIRDIVPAHLAIHFIFRFYTYAELIATGKTYAQITGVTYDQLYNGGLT